MLHNFQHYIPLQDTFQVLRARYTLHQPSILLVISIGTIERVKLAFSCLSLNIINHQYYAYTGVEPNSFIPSLSNKNQEAKKTEGRNTVLTGRRTSSLFSA